MHSTVVVLPAPLAPIRPTISPAGTSRSRSSTTTLVPYDLRRPRTVTTCGSLMSTSVPLRPPPARRPTARTGPPPRGRDPVRPRQKSWSGLRHRGHHGGAGGPAGGQDRGGQRGAHPGQRVQRDLRVRDGQHALARGGQDEAVHHDG